MGTPKEILLADDNVDALETLNQWLDLGIHKVIGKCSSVEQVEKMVCEGGLRPNVALVDNQFPKVGDGERAAGIIRRCSPKTIVVSYSSDRGLEWGDINLSKGGSLKDLDHVLDDLPLFRSRT